MTMTQVKVLRDRLVVLDNMDKELAKVFQFNQDLKVTVTINIYYKYLQTFNTNIIKHLNTNIYLMAILI